MPVSYNSNLMIPAPLVDINKSYNRTQSGDQKLGAIFNITITGQLVAYKGSPDSSRVFWNQPGDPPDETDIFDDTTTWMGALERKQEALRELFADDGYLFEITPLDGSPPISFYSRTVSLDFAAGLWTYLTDYTIVLEATQIFISGSPLGDEDDFNQFLTQANENWTIEMAEDNEHIFNVSHNISAVGRTSYASDGTEIPGWVSASGFVQSKLGYQSGIGNSPGVLNLPAVSGYTPYNYFRSLNMDELDGSYGISETWVLSLAAAREDFEVQSTFDVTTGRTTVNVQGTVTGLNTRDDNFQLTTSKYTAAATYWSGIQGDIYVRGNTYAGVSLNPQALSQTVGENPIAGVISYNYVYDNRPPNITPSSLIETINVQDNFQNDVFAAIPIIGRTAGPIFQNMNTKTPRSRTLSIELHYPSASGAWSFQNKPDVSAIVSMVTPTATNVFQSDGNDNWDWKNGIYTYLQTWTYGN